MSTVIKVENVSKQYRLGQIGTGTLSHDLNRWWHKVRGKEDPFLKIGEANDRSQKGSSDYVWALQDINFEVQQGEVLGIIGRNGAGKSTLLKILSKTTAPTTGSIKIKGRIASLLEVGTGFHPELSGRDNIFLNGAILGMTKQEIKRKFDEIVDFSGVERYIDTPVKRYSSGMYVRLAFAVAAHLESEILILDEVLAVGDAEFQKKCLGKMGEVSKNEGRTVILVSHNMSSIIQLCKKAIVMSNGNLVNYSLVDKAIEYYLGLGKKNGNIDLATFENRTGSGEFRIFSIDLFCNDEITNEIPLGSRIKFLIKVKNIKKTNSIKLRVIIGIYNSLGEGFLRFDTKSTNADILGQENNFEVICNVEDTINIRPDKYSLNIAILNENEIVDYIVDAANITVLNFDYFKSGKEMENIELSKVYYKHKWIQK